MKHENGQVALLVLLLSAIALTLGLSVSDRIRTNVKIDKDDELLQRAFNVAESAIESYVSRGTTEYESGDGSVATITVEDVGGELIDFGEYVVKDNYGFFWLVDHDDQGNINYSSYYANDQIDICLNQLEGGVAVYYYKYNLLDLKFEVDRRVYNITADFVHDGLDVNAGGVCGGYERGIIDFNLGQVGTRYVPVLLVIKPIGGGGRMGISGLGIPSQGKMIISEGVSGDAKTVVKMLQRFDVSYYMSFMLEGVVSGGDLNNE